MILFKIVHNLMANLTPRLYGVDIDPFDVDSRLPEPIDLQQSGNMFNVDVKMKDIKVQLFSENLDRSKTESISRYYPNCQVFFCFLCINIKTVFEIVPRYTDCPGSGLMRVLLPEVKT